ncbi:hypothetical protein KKP04_00010 [Rhodomicrobium sp. Az07]|uniref:hypothetical protein n=1 Tax=Rhodomicrobium sp. Az07 TaxID=2839034 RepID=UPI001BE88F76|nr:hypothetical protein [Rhodomicrobium sp. Az07]MBT3069256.1 hypothetical protein [Rhodomicrobium sp. Az07]
MWSRDALVDLVEKRRKAKEQLPNADAAVLAYARWQGLTQEDGIDRDAAKEALDRLVDAAEPEEWTRLTELAGHVDDRLLKSVMHYALSRALEDVQGRIRSLEDGPEPAPDTPSRRRGRGRSR